MDLAWQMVTCKTCRRSFQCAPWDDYYNATNAEDGVCERCLLDANGIHPDNVVTIVSPRAALADSPPGDLPSR